jgi:tRNA(Ile)-lysidine synthase
MAQVDPFLQNTRLFITRCGLLAPRQGVLAAVSGGADSVALADALRRLGHPLTLGHVNHGLRKQASADAQFVEDLAGRWKLPFLLTQVDTPALAAAWKMGVEEAARKARYQALEAMAAQADCPAVAVAHHADDQVETVIQRAFRGTHLRGLAGMPAKRPMAGGLVLVRPLLWARRSEIEDYCRRRRLAWRTDHTNAQTEYTRNFIRHQLLPLARARINPKADEAILRLACSAAQAQALIEELAGRLFERSCRKIAPGRVALRAAPLRKAPPLVAATALRQALEWLGAPQQDLSQERFDDLLAVLRGQLPSADMPGDIAAALAGSDLVLQRKSSQ